MDEMKTNLRKVHAHLYFIDDPHPASYASLLMLNKYFYLQTDECLSKWMKFRKEYLRSRLNKSGTLTCDYCGKSGLVIRTKKENRRATIDHAIPKSITKKRSDPKNFRVACHKCNQDKKTMNEFEFRKYLLINVIKKNCALNNVIRLFVKYCSCSLRFCLTFI
jgi:5-methylcytosine-specific restriction endonuclease McrA